MTMQNWDLDGKDMPAAKSNGVTPKKKKTPAKPKMAAKEKDFEQKGLKNKENVEASAKKAKKHKSTSGGEVVAAEPAKDVGDKEAPKSAKKRKSLNKKAEVEKAPSNVEDVAEAPKSAKKKKSLKEKVEVEESSPSKKPRKSGKAKFSVSAEPADSAEPSGDDEGATDQSELVKSKKLSAKKRKSLKYKERKRKEKIDKLKSKMPKDKLEEYLNPKVSDEKPSEAALNYLKQWKTDKSAWKFSKLRQTWLLKNWYDASSVKKDDFALLLEYMQPLKGLSRDATMKGATEMLEKHKDSTDKKSKLIASRSTQVLQMLD